MTCKEQILMKEWDKTFRSYFLFGHFIFIPSFSSLTIQFYFFFLYFFFLISSENLI